MIKFQRITTTDAALYKYMEQLMTASFPSEEYRPLEELRNYTDSKPHFYCNIILHQNTPVGFITYWDFGHFCYVEHFAIDPSQRNGGHGKNVLNQLCHQLKKPIILEVEMPEEEMQPPYKSGDDYLPMLLMAYGDLECDKDFEQVKKCIYREVYNTK